MKAAVADEAKRCAKFKRKPDERYQEAFEFAIHRAKHFVVEGLKRLNKYPADVKDNTVILIDILDKWECERNYNFLNFYSDHHLSKKHSGVLKDWGIRKYIKNIKTDSWYARDPKERADRIRDVIKRFQTSKRVKGKARWNNRQRIYRADKIKYGWK